MFSTIFKKKYFNQQFFLITLLVLLLLSIPFISLAATTATQYPAKDVTFWQALTAGLSNSLGTLTLLITSLFARLFVMAALIFDNLLAIGLSTGFFKSSFVNEAWSSVRDFANVAFILGFLFVAFKVMLGQESRWEQTFIKIIIAALVMNFSLFLSLAVVDAGNITARVFYNAIGTDYNKSTDANNFIKDRFLIARKFYENTEQKDLSFKSISGYFQSFVKPEKLFGVNSFKAWKAKGGGGANIISFMFLNGVVIAYFIMLSKTLFKGGFMFLSRIVWLVYYVIISPLALISMFLPSASSYWSSWLKNIANKSFCIVVYLFLLWLAALIMKSGIADMNSDDFWMMIAVFIFKAIIVYEILDMATKQGSKMCGDSGFLMKGAVGLAGLAAKVAGGPALAVSRNVFGSLGDRMQRGEGFIGSRLKNKSLEGNFATSFLARQGMLFGDKMTNFNFGKKSYNEDMKTRQSKLQQLRDSYSGDQQNTFDRKVAGNPDYKSINGFESQKELTSFMQTVGITGDIKNNEDGMKTLKNQLSGLDKSIVDKAMTKHFDKMLVDQGATFSSMMKTILPSTQARKVYTKKRKDIVSNTQKEQQKQKLKANEVSKIEIRSAREQNAVQENLNAINISDTPIGLVNLGKVSDALNELAKNSVLNKTEQKDKIDKVNKITENAKQNQILFNNKYAEEIQKEIEILKQMEKSGASSDKRKKQKENIENLAGNHGYANMEDYIKNYSVAKKNVEKSIKKINNIATSLASEKMASIKGKAEIAKQVKIREIEKSVDDLEAGESAAKTTGVGKHVSSDSTTGSIPIE